MPRSGGESDKLGNLFEAVWTVNCALDVLLGRYRVFENDGQTTSATLCSMVSHPKPFPE